MRTPKLDEPEYPYGSQPAIVLRPAEARLEIAPSHAGRGALRILLWLAAAGLLLLIIAAAPFAIIAYRGWAQASRIAQLEALGCDVGYSYTGNTNNAWGEFLEDTFGRESFGVVHSVEAHGLESPQQVATVCNLCRGFETLRSFFISGDGFRVAQITNWPTFHELQFLDIASPSVTDDDLARIADMRSVEHLSLASGRITDAGIHQLSKLPKLSNLRLTSPQLLGTIAPNERGFPSLTDLYISSAPAIEDEGIIRLGPMPALTSLYVNDTPLGDRALAHLTSGHRLTWVDLPGTNVGDEGVAALAKCGEVRSIDLSETKVTDSGVAHLRNCSALRFLYLAGTRVTGKQFSLLTSNQIGLSLDRTAVTDATLSDVFRIAGLEFLSLNETQVTGETMPPRALEPLNLNYCPLTDAGIKKLAQMPAGALSVSSTNFTDDHLMLFAASDTMQSLDASRTKITAAGLRAFYETRKKRLTVSGGKESLYVGSDIAEQYVADQFNEGFLMNGQPIATRESSEPPPAQP
jgi:Leucine Rich Repeat (LRR) protein